MEAGKSANGRRGLGTQGFRPHRPRGVPSREGLRPLGGPGRNFRQCIGAHSAVRGAMRRQERLHLVPCEENNEGKRGGRPIPRPHRKRRRQGSHGYIQGRIQGRSQERLLPARRRQGIQAAPSEHRIVEGAKRETSAEDRKVPDMRRAVIIRA